MSQDVTLAIRTFIAENLLFKADGGDLANETSLIEAGIIDSTAVLELVSFVESEFGISVGDAEIIPENLDSIDTIARFVTAKLAAKAA